MLPVSDGQDMLSNVVYGHIWRYVRVQVGKTAMIYLPSAKALKVNLTRRFLLIIGSSAGSFGLQGCLPDNDNCAFRKVVNLSPVKPLLKL